MTPEDFLAKMPNEPVAYGEMLFFKVAGSHSHNTNIASSDLDGIGVYQCRTEECLGIYRIKETVVNSTNDISWHEIGKFARLLIKGNPNILECLFTKRRAVTSSAAWGELVNERHRFLSRKALGSYLGYLNAQLHKLFTKKRVHTTGGQFSAKFAYHLVRLGWDGRRIARGQEPVVWKEGAERDLLLEIRAGEYGQKAIEQMAKDLIADIERAKPWRIPEKGDEEWLDNWVVKLRLEQLEKGGSDGQGRI